MKEILKWASENCPLKEILKGELKGKTKTKTKPPKTKAWETKGGGRR